MRIIKVRIVPDNINKVSVDIINGQTPIFINGGGTDDYNNLKNIPKLNGEKIIGNKTSNDYGIKQIRALTNSEIEELINSFI